MPAEEYYARHVYHQFVIRTKNRDDLQRYLRQKGISTGIHYPLPLHKQPAYISEYGNEKFPVTEILTKEILSLPIYPELSESQIEYISENINKF